MQITLIRKRWILTKKTYKLPNTFWYQHTMSFWKSFPGCSHYISRLHFFSEFFKSQLLCLFFFPFDWTQFHYKNLTRSILNLQFGILAWTTLALVRNNSSRCEFCPWWDMLNTQLSKKKQKKKQEPHLEYD